MEGLRGLCDENGGLKNNEDGECMIEIRMIIGSEKAGIDT